MFFASLITPTLPASFHYTLDDGLPVQIGRAHV